MVSAVIGGRLVLSVSSPLSRLSGGRRQTELVLMIVYEALYGYPPFVSTSVSTITPIEDIPSYSRRQREADE